MNAPFKPPVIEEILADACVSTSGLKKNPAAVIAEAQIRQVAILNRNRPVAYVIAPHVWEYLCDLVTDQRLLEQIERELEDGGEEIEVSIDDL
jgi:antitoxin StbD